MRRGEAYQALIKLINEKIHHDKMRTVLTAAHRGRLDAKARRLQVLREFLINDPAFKAAGTGFTPETADALLQEIARYTGPG